VARLRTCMLRDACIGGRLPSEPLHGVARGRSRCLGHGGGWQNTCGSAGRGGWLRPRSGGLRGCTCMPGLGTCTPVGRGAAAATRTPTRRMAPETCGGWGRAPGSTRGLRVRLRGRRCTNGRRCDGCDIAGMEGAVPPAAPQRRPRLTNSLTRRMDECDAADAGAVVAAIVRANQTQEELDNALVFVEADVLRAGRACAIPSDARDGRILVVVAGAGIRHRSTGRRRCEVALQVLEPRRNVDVSDVPQVSVCKIQFTKTPALSGRQAVP